MTGRKGKERATSERSGRPKEGDPSEQGFHKGPQEKGPPLLHSTIRAEGEMEWKIKMK